MRTRPWPLGTPWLAFLVGLCVHRLAAAPPVIERIDPPNWWAGHPLNPVRIMVTGAHLAGAHVEAAGAFHIDSVAVNAAGTHAFFDLSVPPSAPPGRTELTVSTPAGTAKVPFELLARLPASGRFQGFSDDDLIYLIMPDRFANGDPGNDNPAKAPGLVHRSKPRHYHGGDFRGILEHLPYLRDLGVTALWLTPWYDNNDRLDPREQGVPPHRLDGPPGDTTTDYHGYGAVDLYAVDEHFGDLAALRELVDAAHAQGLKVIQDQVANHVGPHHPWVERPPTAGWFHGDPVHHSANAWQTWTVTDPHSSPAFRRRTLEGWFADILPDLNQDDPECRRHLIQNAVWWVESTGVDGIRQDTAPYAPRDFWSDWSAELKRARPGLKLLGEVLNEDAATVSFFQGGRRRFDGIDSGFDSLFDFPLYYRVREAFAGGRSLRPLVEQLGRDHLYVNPDRLVTFLGLHDVDRFMNVRRADTAGLKLAFTFLLTARGIPLIYYGDEIGLPGGGDPDNRRDFPGGWPDDPRNAFTAAGRTAAERDVFDHVRRLASLRRRLAPLRHGEHLHLDLSDSTYAFARRVGTNCVIVALNNDRSARAVDIPVEALALKDGARFTDALGGAEAAVRDGRIQLTLPPRSAAVLR